MRTRLRSPRFLIMFFALNALFAMGQFHRSAGSVLAPIFADKLVINADQIGLAMGVLFLFSGLTQLPSSILIDRFGPRIVVSSMTLISVAGCFFIAFAEGWIGVFIGRAMLGLGFGAAFLGANTIFINWGGIELISTLIGRYLFVGGVGALCSTFPLAYALEIFDFPSVFITLGISTLLVALLNYIVTRDLPEDDIEEPTIPLPKSKKTIRGSIKGLAVILKDRRIWPVLAIAALMYSPLQVLIGLWAGPFLKDVHYLPAMERSYLLFVMAAGMVIGMPFFGPLERLFNTRRTIVLVCTSAIAFLFLAMATFAYAHLWLTISSFTLITILSPFFITVLAHNQAMFPAEYASRVVSLINLVALIGIFFMQYITGFIIHFVTDNPNVTGSLLGYRLMFGLMTVVFFIITYAYSRTIDIPPKAIS